VLTAATIEFLEYTLFVAVLDAGTAIGHGNRHHPVARGADTSTALSGSVYLIALSAD
jgi:hypothetical protein